MELVCRPHLAKGTGMGHLMRLVALAGMLPAKVGTRPFAKTLALREVGSLRGVGEVERIFSRVLEIPQHLSPKEEADWLARQLGQSGVLFALDGYDVDLNYQKKLKATGAKVLVVDDFAGGPFAADAVINHAPGLSPQQFQIAVGTQLCLGPEFALLRGAFSARALRPRKLSAGGGLLICLGGEDPENFTFECLRAALDAGFSEVELVLGPAYQHEASLRPYADGAVRLHRGLSAGKLCELMAKSRAGLLSASTIALEAAAVGLPLLIGYYVDNQKLIHDGFVSAKAAYGLGDLRALTENDLIVALEQLSDLGELDRQLKAQQQMFGRGPEQTIPELVLGLLGGE